MLQIKIMGESFRNKKNFDPIFSNPSKENIWKEGKTLF
jgi:hypothetical protein